jgi:hypothetical protein
MDLPERSAPAGSAETLEEDWRQLRDLLGGDDREQLRALAERIAGLETRFTISQDRRNPPPHSLFRIRPLAFGILAVALLITMNQLWQRSRVARVVAVLEEIPGLVILESQSGSRKIKGLRDPLGPDPGSVLAGRGIDASRFQLDFLPFSSMETQWADQRNREQARLLESTRQEFVTAVGDLDSAREALRRRDLQSLTSALFHLKFPEAAGQADIVLENDQWKLRGNVTEALHAQIMEGLPQLGLSGEIDTSELRKITTQSLERVKEEIEAITLVYLSGRVDLTEDGQRQADRLARLLRQYDELSDLLEEKPATIEVHSPALKLLGQSNEALVRERIAKTRRIIAESAGLSSFRIVAGVRDESEIGDGPAGVGVRLLPATGYRR